MPSCDIPSLERHPATNIAVRGGNQLHNGDDRVPEPHDKSRLHNIRSTSQGVLLHQCDCKCGNPDAVVIFDRTIPTILLRKMMMVYELICFEKLFRVEEEMRLS